METIEETTVTEAPASTDAAATEAVAAPASALVLETNFFTGIDKLLPEKVTLTLTFVKKGADLVVGVRPQVNGEDVDDALTIRPLMLTHPATALDAGFFETVSAAVSKYKSFADELGAFEEGLKKPEPKKVPPKPASKPAQAKKAPPKKPTPPPKPAKPAPPTPQEKAKTIAIEAEKLASAGKTDEAIRKFKDAAKLHADPAYLGEVKKLELMKYRKEIEKDYPKLDGLFAGANYGDLANRLKEIHSKDPDNEKVAEIKQKLTNTLGTGFVNQLLPNI